jgi:UMF1 family MFS transporter
MCFVLVGVWWILFSRYFFLIVPETRKAIEPGVNIWTKGMEELKWVWKQIQSHPDCKNFLSAFFFWSMGVQTVMLLAPLFGESELHLASDELIMVVIIVQLLAIFGAWLFSFISSKIQNTNTLAIAVVLWSLICIAAFYVQNKEEFFTLAAILGVEFNRFPAQLMPN